MKSAPGVDLKPLWYPTTRIDPSEFPVLDGELLKKYLPATEIVVSLPEENNAETDATLSGAE